jgi:hypothetical protein
MEPKIYLNCLSMKEQSHYIMGIVIEIVVAFCLFLGVLVLSNSSVSSLFLHFHCLQRIIPVEGQEWNQNP